MRVVRQLEPRDIPGVVALQRLCFPGPFPAELLWTAEHLMRHLEVYQEGQMVAVEGEQMVASASAVAISEERWQAHGTWDETVGGFYFDHADPQGSTLYGADISVHPDFRSQGIGRALYEARFELVRKRGMARFGTACRMPDFAFHETGRTVKEYAHAVASGELQDRTLTPLLRYGLALIDVLEGYMPDEESGHAAALLEWTP